jgi:signal transduction histidine kinase
VSIVADDPTLQIRVRDDGVGLPAEWRFERDAGVGLKNVADRLEHIYGTANLLKLDRVPTGGVEVQIALPGPPPGRAGTADPAVAP